MVKRIASILLSICVIGAMMPAMAFGATTENCTCSGSEHVAAIGDTHYDTLQKAIDAAQTGNTIVLIGDKEKYVEETTNIAAGTEITIDLNGREIYVYDNNTQQNLSGITNRGNLTLTDSSTEKDGQAWQIDNYGELTINNGETYSITNKSGGSIIINDGVTNYLDNTDGGSVTVNGGIFERFDPSEYVDTNGVATELYYEITYSISSIAITSLVDYYAVNNSASKYKNDMAGVDNANEGTALFTIHKAPENAEINIEGFHKDLKIKNEANNTVKLNGHEISADFEGKINEAPVVVTVSDIVDQIYTGYDIKPEIIITTSDSSINLVKGIDYDIAYANNKNVGIAATATIRRIATSNYIWKDETPIEKTFNVIKADPTITFSNLTQSVRNITAPTVTIAPTKTNGTVTLKYKKADADDNTYAADLPTEAGKYTVQATLSGDSNLNDATETAEFNIYVPRPPAPAPVPQKPEIKVDEVGGAVNLSSDGRTLTITADEGYRVKNVTVNGESKGAVIEVTGLKTGDVVVVEFENIELAELNTLIKEVKFKASTKYTSKKNVKVTAKVLAGDIDAIAEKGYTVKYRFLRADSKNGEYTFKKEKTENTYINTKGVKGNKYYYRVQLCIYDGDTLIGQTELKQSEYGVRTWKK